MWCHGLTIEIILRTTPVQRSWSRFNIPLTMKNAAHQGKSPRNRMKPPKSSKVTTDLQDNIPFLAPGNSKISNQLVVRSILGPVVGAIIASSTRAQAPLSKREQRLWRVRLEVSASSKSSSNRKIKWWGLSIDTRCKDIFFVGKAPYLGELLSNYS